MGLAAVGAKLSSSRGRAFVVHARLDALIGSKQGKAGAGGNRTAALVMQMVLILTAGAFAYYGRFWIAGGLGIAALFYFMELARQKSPESLKCR